MASKRKAAAPIDETGEVGAFGINYTQGDEIIALTFHTEERRDHELNRLRGIGINAEKAE